MLLAGERFVVPSSPDPSPADRFDDASGRLAEIAARVRKGEASADEIDLLLAEVIGAKEEEFGVRTRAKSGEGGIVKLLAYFKANVGQELSRSQLAMVAGIGEWARRVRQLRVEQGYDIQVTERKTYVLRSPDPDEGVTAEWQLMNRIRKKPGSSTDRIKEYLEAKVGTVVTRDDLDYVAGRNAKGKAVKEGTRRTRALRDEQGWPITSHVDEPDLSPGEYRLVSADPADRRDPRQRLYEEKVVEKVYERDAYTCQVCGRDREKAEKAGDSRFYLEVHHKVAVADELDALPEDKLNDAENLTTLCHACHTRETSKLQKNRRQQRSAG